MRRFNSNDAELVNVFRNRLCATSHLERFLEFFYACFPVSTLSRLWFFQFSLRVTASLLIDVMLVAKFWRRANTSVRAHDCQNAGSAGVRASPLWAFNARANSQSELLRPQYKLTTTYLFVVVSVTRQTSCRFISLYFTCRPSFQGKSWEALKFGSLKWSIASRFQDYFIKATVRPTAMLPFLELWEETLGAIHCTVHCRPAWPLSVIWLGCRKLWFAQSATWPTQKFSMQPKSRTKDD